MLTRGVQPGTSTAENRRAPCSVAALKRCSAKIPGAVSPIKRPASPSLRSEVRGRSTTSGFHRRMALARGATLSLTSSAISAPRSMASSANSLASSVQSSTVSLAESYFLRRSFLSCLPGLGASNRPSRAPAPNPISRKVTAVPAELPPSEGFVFSSAHVSTLSNSISA